MGIRSPDVVYVQNDSGDSARFFALDRRTGRTLAVFTVPGASNVDWEDLAVARDARGVASIWLADTGDNDAVRREVRVYRVDEPAVTTGRNLATLRTSRPDVWRLRYPGGPVNVEALAVDPGGSMTLATKSPLGDTVLYTVPPAPDAKAVRIVRRIGAFTVPQSDGPFGGGSLFGLLVTGAAISPDGRRLVLRTYTNAYLWNIDRGDVAAAIHARPQRIPLPDQPQGEGVAFNGSGLLIDSEQAGSAVWFVAVPPPATTSTTSPTKTSPTKTGPTKTSPTKTSPTKTSQTKVATTATTTSITQATPASAGQRGRGRWTEISGAVVVAVAVAAAGVLAVRRRGARR